MTTTVKTRRRGDDLVRAVHSATVEQLCSVGYGRLSIEGIAAAAGTGKASIYRRWDSLDELVRDALGELLPSPPDIEADATLRDGLFEMLSYLNDALFDSKRAAFQAVAAHSGDDSSMLRELFRDRVLDPCQDKLMDLMGRHGAPADARRSLIASVAPAMVMYDCTLGRPQLTGEQLGAVVDTVLIPLIR